MLEKIKDYKVILASKSPRRHYLLNELGIEFEVLVKENINEDYPENLPYTEIPVYLAEKKADAYSDIIKTNELVITADTIVWCNKKVLGKPENREDAIAMLKELSNNIHTVITGVHIRTNDFRRSISSVTKVYFKELTEKEIIYYIDKYKPFDKAGAYGIQEWIGYIGIEKIDGSFYNVMGLPIQHLYEALNSFIK